MQLADKLGVSQAQISNWESERSSPSRDMLENISAVLGVQAPDGVALGEWLSQKRDEKKLTQAELAEKAKVSQITISFIETGKTESPQEATLKRLENVLGKLPASLSEEVKEKRSVEDFIFLGPFPASNWEENVGTDKIPCIYVFYDHLKRPV